MNSGGVATPGSAFSEVAVGQTSSVVFPACSGLRVHRRAGSRERGPSDQPSPHSRRTTRRDVDVGSRARGTGSRSRRCAPEVGTGAQTSFGSARNGGPAPVQVVPGQRSDGVATARRIAPPMRALHVRWASRYRGWRDRFEPPRPSPAVAPASPSTVTREMVRSSEEATIAHARGESGSSYHPDRRGRRDEFRGPPLDDRGRWCGRRRRLDTRGSAC